MGVDVLGAATVRRLAIGEMRRSFEILRGHHRGDSLRDESISVCSGFTLGRESPTIHLGAATGLALTKLFATREPPLLNPLPGLIRGDVEELDLGIRKDRP